MSARKESMGMLAVCVALISLPFIVFAGEKLIWRSVKAPITISADLPDSVPEALFPFHAELQTWGEASVSAFDKFYLIESNNHPERVSLDNGFALLFDKKTLESMVFLRDPGAAFRYMNGRAEINYVNAVNGAYEQCTISGSDIEGNSLLYPGTLREIFLMKEELKNYGIRVGKPIQMTAYFNRGDEAVPERRRRPDFIEIAFSREFQGMRMMPWGIPLYNGLTSADSYITVFIDEDGISNVLLRLMFEKIFSGEEKPVLGLEEALNFFERHVSAIILEEKICIDYVSLEYIPVPTKTDYTDIEIIPAWNFYADYEQDADRRVFSINAFTGEIL